MRGWLVQSARLLAEARTRTQVCGKPGHNAGFVGAQYIDCPNRSVHEGCGVLKRQVVTLHTACRPCFLCKEQGHTTTTCPYRYTGEEASTSAAAGLLAGMRKRETGGR